MKDGFIRVAAATPDLKVADPVFNREQTWKMMQEAASQDVKILVFPELGLTGYTCSDLFLQDTLIDQAKEELLWLLDASKDMDMLTFIGLPWMKDGKLYNVAAAIKDGELLGLVPKRHLPNYSEFYELRHFNPGPVKPDVVEWGETDPVWKQDPVPLHEYPGTHSRRRTLRGRMDDGSTERLPRESRSYRDRKLLRQR